MHEPDYRYAARLVNVVEGQDHLVAKTFKGETGKYGRYLARIWGEDKNLSQALRNEFPDYFTE